jgi:hypothetical protein
VEFSERIYFKTGGPAAPCFLCGGETTKWLTPESTRGEFVASHMACGAKVLIAFEEYRRTGVIPERQMRWLTEGRQKRLPAPG